MISASDDDDMTTPEFPLGPPDRPKITQVIALVRGRLPFMSPSDLRAAASVLLALERLPAVTPGIHVSFGFASPDRGGNYGWAEIEFLEDEFRLGTGRHFYDPAVGGDTESQTVFEAIAGGDWREGEIDDWIQAAKAIAADGRITAEDYSEDVDWSLDFDESEDEDNE